jgi:nitrilase
LRFPDLYQHYAYQGADILCVPSAFTKKTGEAHWEILLRARAVENLCYVIAPNQTGKDGRGVATYGHSMIIDPWGKILARASGRKEEIIYADINQSTLKEKEKLLPGIAARYTIRKSK